LRRYWAGPDALGRPQTAPPAMEGMIESVSVAEISVRSFAGR
jgi:hypothetical protein